MHHKIGIWDAIAAVLPIMGLSCLAFYSFERGISAGHQAAEENELGQSQESALRQRPTSVKLAARGGPAISASSRVVPEGTLIAQIEIPSLGLKAMVDEGVSTGTLRKAVGHIPGTALPGEGGNVALAGHRDTFFRKLNGLKPNDVVVLTTISGEYRYRVHSTQVVDPSDSRVLIQSGRPSLTLVTCYPFYYIGPAPKRFIVKAWRTDG
jgi:sortase A